MEIILLLIYASIVWLIYFKLKLLPWNMANKVIVFTLPVIGLTATILLLNIFVPSTADVRVMNYVVQIVPRVTGRVIEVPVEPNRPVKKGDVLFRIDPESFDLAIKVAEARIPQLEAGVTSAAALERQLNEQLAAAAARRRAAESRLPAFEADMASAGAMERELQDQLAASASKILAIQSRLDLARKRIDQYRQLADAGAGRRFDLEQAEADAAQYQADLDGATSAESQAKQKLSARTESGDFADVAIARANMEQARADLAAAQAAESEITQKLSARTESGELAELAQAKALLVQAQADLETARWQRDETTVYAPADGSVINLQLRPGSYAAALPLRPVMTFVENEQWIVALFHQNELHQVAPGDEAEISLKFSPGHVYKCKVDSIVWANGQGQSPLIGTLPETGPVAPPDGRFAVKLMLDGDDVGAFLPAGARGHGAIYTQHLKFLHVIRKVMLRVGTKLDYVIPKLH